MELHGITITLLERTLTGADDFNRPEYTETEVEVSDVLVSPVTDAGEELLEQLNLTGRKAVYTLALPKGDNAVSFQTYMAMPGIFSAIYRGGNNELLIRKSLTLEGKELAGDFYDHPDAWEEEYKGIKIACEGTKPAIRLAMFDLAGENFTVSFRSDKEDQGLTIEEVETLMEELFPEDLMK